MSKPKPNCIYSDEDLIKHLTDAKIGIPKWTWLVGCDRTTITRRYPRLLKEGFINGEKIADRYWVFWNIGDDNK